VQVRLWAQNEGVRKDKTNGTGINGAFHKKVQKNIGTTDGWVQCSAIREVLGGTRRERRPAWSRTQKKKRSGGTRVDGGGSCKEALGRNVKVRIKTDLI